MSKNSSQTEKFKLRLESTLKINEDWLEQAFKEGGMPRSFHKQSEDLYDEGGKCYKYCLCCGTKFYPTAGHEHDQLYCKCVECRRVRDRLRHQVRYRRLMSSKDTRLAECARQKKYREARKQRLGIEPQGKAGGRRRDSVRRMKAEINGKLTDIELCMMGFIRSLGYSTKEDVDETFSRFRTLGRELQFSVPPPVSQTSFADG